MMTKIFDPHKSSIGNLDANIVSLFAYLGAVIIGFIPGLAVFAWLVPLIIFFVEKNSAFVKFHAIQAFLIEVASAIISLVLTLTMGGIVGFGMYNAINGELGTSALGSIGTLGLIGMALSLVIIVFSVFAMINAYQYKDYHIPFLGNLADKFLSKRK